MSTPPPSSDPGPLGPGSLGRRILLRVLAVVALLAVGLGTVTTVALQRQLIGQLDEQLDAVTARQLDTFGPGRGPMGPKTRAVMAGQPIGTLVMEIDADGSASGSLLSKQVRPGDITRETLDQVRGAARPDDHVTAELAGLGRYRLTARTVGDETIVIGLPLEQVDTTLTQLIWLEVLMTAVALIIAAGLVGLLVTRSLRPLNRLAAASREVAATPLESGAVDLAVRVPTVAKDTSDVGRLSGSFNEMIRHVGAALTAREASETRLRRFVADASHELRNPLAAIRGYAELTRRDRDALPPSTLHALERVDSEAVRMSSLVEDLLLLARLDAGREMTAGPVDLSEVALNAVSDARVAGRDHTWRLRLPDEPVVVTGDADRLHQVLVNLLANARTHTPPGTTVELGLDVAPDPDAGALLTVTDDGPGIPADLLPHVFERFTRGDAGRSRAGGNTSTGLGLAIVGAVVAGHRGRVEVTSTPGRTVFTVRLPM